MFKITEVKTKSSQKIKQCPYAQMKVIPQHPFRAYIVGASQSGKTNLMLFLLTTDGYYKNYFDKIFIVSPTAKKLDKTYDILEDMDYKDGESLMFFNCDTSVLDAILEIQVENTKKDKTRVIFDDCISYQKFMRSDSLLQFAIMSRHYNISMFLLSQAYHSVPKPIRMNMSAIVYFKGSNKEQEIIYEDYCPPRYTKKQFMEKINHATDKPYSFLYIDLHIPLHGKIPRYRRNLDERLI